MNAVLSFLRQPTIIAGLAMGAIIVGQFAMLRQYHDRAVAATARAETILQESGRRYAGYELAQKKLRDSLGFQIAAREESVRQAQARNNEIHTQPLRAAASDTTRMSGERIDAYATLVSALDSLRRNDNIIIIAQRSELAVQADMIASLQNSFAQSQAHVAELEQALRTVAEPPTHMLRHAIIGGTIGVLATLSAIAIGVIP